MKIGYSLSRCLWSIARGDVDIKDVLYIVSNTAYPDRETLIGHIEMTMLDRNLELHIKNATELWDSNRIVQPRLTGKAHPGSDPMWEEAPPACNPETVLQRELATKWAWKWIDNQLCIGMEGNLDTVYDATLKITGGFLNVLGDHTGAELLAQHLVDQHNDGIGK